MHARMNGKHVACVFLLLAPLLWLWPCVFGGRTFVPYDTAQFPPVSLTLSPQQLAAAHDGANFDVTEVPPWFLPELVFARDELREGRLPTWNPHARGGAPLHAHGLIGLCYPPNWVALLADDPASRLALVAWLNLALGGLLAFGLLRRTGLTTLPAWFGALLFQLSGPMATNAFFWMRLGSFVWMPGVLWAVLALAQAERVRPRHLGALGGSFAMTWLAGFPPFAATTTVLGSAFAAWLVIARLRAVGRRGARSLALAFAAAFALGGALALPQVLPSLQFFPHSARETKPDFQRIADSAFDSYGLLGFMLPDAISHPSAANEAPYPLNNVLGLLWNTRLRGGAPTHPNFNYTEYAVFIGQLGLLLALVGALLGRGHHRGFAVTAWLLCAGLALFWPGVRLLYLLPLFENVWPLRWLAPGTLCIAWLAALGLERLLASARALPLTLAAVAAAMAIATWTAVDAAHWTEADSRAVVQRLAAKFGCDEQAVRNHVGSADGLDRFRAAYVRLDAEGDRAATWLAGTALLLLLFALLRDRRHRTTLGAIAGLAGAMQLGLHGATVTRGSACATSVDTPVHAFLRERAAALADGGGFTIARGSTGIELQSQLPPGQLMTRGIRDLQFYSHFDGRSLQPVHDLLGKTLGDQIAGKGYLTSALPHTLPAPQPGENVTEHPFEHALLDLLGVRYVLSTGRLRPDGSGEREPLPHSGTPVAIPGCPTGFFVQERTTALPRAVAIGSVQGHSDDAEVVQALVQPTFAPARIAHALASDLPSPLPMASDANAPVRSVRFVRDDPTHIELEVAAGAQPWLLLTDTFLPGWTAMVDDDAATIVRGDHAFRLVRLPPGACRVTFRYDAPGLWSGAALAGLATLAFGLWRFATTRRHRGAQLAT